MLTMSNDKDQRKISLPLSVNEPGGKGVVYLCTAVFNTCFKVMNVHSDLLVFF